MPTLRFGSLRCPNIKEQYAYGCTEVLGTVIQTAVLLRVW